jgi:hypothetical protein
VTREALREKARAYYRRRGQHVRERMQAYYGMNPEKVRAHNTVFVEIRAGRMERQPCEVCGNPRTDAHHDDYARPLDVRWLCRVHHREIHQRVSA